MKNFISYHQQSDLLSVYCTYIVTLVNYCVQICLSVYCTYIVTLVNYCVQICLSVYCTYIVTLVNYCVQIMKINAILYSPKFSWD